MIGKTVSHYKVLEKIGQGGMGIVYKAEDTKLDRLVALKFLPAQISLNEEEKKRFIHEAKATAALNHINIVTIHEINEFEGQTYIAMEYLQGETLKDIIGRGGPMWPPSDKNDKKGRHIGLPLHLEEIINITTQIAEGLNKSHKKDIIHRDIKAANIMITGDGVAKILDFGLAKLRGQTRLTKTGTTLGTIAYMSPEQTLGEKIDHRTDIWSLGVLLYEMLTGQLPFRGEYEQAVMYSIMNEDPEPVTEVRKEVPPTLGQVVSKALEKDPEKRYQDLDELIDDLKSISEGIVPEEIKARMLKAKLRKRRKTIYWVSAIMIIIAAILVGILTRPSEKIDSIAVLPLKNLTGNEEQQYFVDGVTDELIGQLGQVSGFKRVISRTSMMKYKKTEKSLSDIARELKVDAVVEGTVYEAGDKVRIRFQLIDALPEERNLWGETYERPKSDIRMMYSEVTRTITDKIKVNLTSVENKRFANVRKVNPKAYDAYLKGLYLLDRFSKEELESATECFETAVKIAPDWALPYMGLSQSWGRRMQMEWIQATVAMPKIYQYLNKALQLDPNVEGLAARQANIAVWTEWDWKKGEQEFQKALELNPNDAQCRAFYSHFLIIMKQPDEGLKQAKKAVELDPLRPLILSLAGYANIFTGNYESGLDLAKKALSIDPGNFFATGVQAKAYYHLGDLDKWFEAWKKVAWWDDEVLAVIDDIYYKKGFHAAIEKIIEVNEEAAKKGHISHSGQAGRYLMINNIVKAIENFERAYVVHDPSMPYMEVFYSQYGQRNEELRRHPRYIALLKKMNLPIKE